MKRSKLVLLAAFALIGIAGGSVRVPASQITADDHRLSAFGVRLPRAGVVLENPYDPPYSARSFIVPWRCWFADYYEVMHGKGDFPVRASALRADLPTLRLLMEKTYAGYATARSRGWNWNSWFSDWDRALAARGNAQLSLHDAFAQWGRLETFQLDNHSGVAALMDYVSGSVSASLAGPPHGPCTSMQISGNAPVALSGTDPAQQPHAVYEWNGSAFSRAWYVSILHAKGPERPLNAAISASTWFRRFRLRRLRAAKTCYSSAPISRSMKHSGGGLPISACPPSRTQMTTHCGMCSRRRMALGRNGS